MANEITLSVKGRKSGRDIPTAAWFMPEGKAVHLLPNRHSDTEWYKNLLHDPMLKISVNGLKIPAKVKPLTDSNGFDVL